MELLLLKASPVSLVKRSLKDAVLGIAARAGHRLILLARRTRRTSGVHALALTPGQRVILVKLRYANGWRLPGGGLKEGEEPREAVLRELEEEIGMVSYGEVRGKDALWVVEDVLYRPRKWSWEVEAIIEAPLDQLPGDLAPVTFQQMRQLSGVLGASDAPAQ